MPLLTHTLVTSASLTSNYIAYMNWQDSRWTSTPSTKTQDFTFSYTGLGLQTGAIINSVKLKIGSFGSPAHGSSERGARINGTAVATMLTAGIEYDITSHCVAGTNTVQLRFKSGTTNTTYPAPPAAGQGTNERANSGTITFNNVQIIVDYTPPYSTIGLDKTTMDAGQTITATAENWQSGFTYKFTWTFFDMSPRVVTLTGTNKSDVFTVPKTYLAKIPAADSGPLNVKLETFNGITLLGYSERQITLRAGAAEVPVIGGFTATRIEGWSPGGWNKYLANISKATLTMTGVTPSSGSSISTYSIAGQGLSGVNTSSVTTNILPRGTFIYTAKVTDRRGRSTTKTVQIVVVPYTPPIIISAIAYRCTPAGVQDGMGVNARVGVTFEYDFSHTANAPTVTIFYRQKGTTTWTSVTSGVPQVSGVRMTIGAGTLSQTKSYEIRFDVRDTVGAMIATRTVVVGTAAVLLHKRALGKGIGIGSYCEADNSVQINPAWKIKCGQIDNSIPIGVTNGGTGGVTVDQGRHNLTYTNDPLALTLETDLPPNWPQGISMTFVGPSNTTIYHPTSYGNVLTIKTNSECSQLWFTQAGGAVYHRQGNANGWGAPSSSHGWKQIGSDGSTLSDRLTMPRLRLTATTDAAGATANDVALCIGAQSGSHIEMDNNEIMAKSNGTTPSMLYLNSDGGEVQVNKHRVYHEGIITRGTGNPSGGINGNIYIKYT